MSVRRATPPAPRRPARRRRASARTTARPCVHPTRTARVSPGRARPAWSAIPAPSTPRATRATVARTALATAWHALPPRLYAEEGDMQHQHVPSMYGGDRNADCPQSGVCSITGAVVLRGHGRDRLPESAGTAQSANLARCDTTGVSGNALTTLLADANGAGKACRRNNHAYASDGTTASQANYPSGKFTTPVTGEITAGLGCSATPALHDGSSPLLEDRSRMVRQLHLAALTSGRATAPERARTSRTRRTRSRAFTSSVRPRGPTTTAPPRSRAST